MISHEFICLRSLGPFLQISKEGTASTKGPVILSGSQTSFRVYGESGLNWFSAHSPGNWLSEGGIIITAVPVKSNLLGYRFPVKGGTSSPLILFCLFGAK